MDHYSLGVMKSEIQFTPFDESGVEESITGDVMRQWGYRGSSRTTQRHLTADIDTNIGQLLGKRTKLKRTQYIYTYKTYIHIPIQSNKYIHRHKTQIHTGIHKRTYTQPYNIHRQIYRHTYIHKHTDTHTYTSI